MNPKILYVIYYENNAHSSVRKENKFYLFDLYRNKIFRFQFLSFHYLYSVVFIIFHEKNVSSGFPYNTLRMDEENRNSMQKKTLIKRMIIDCENKK